MSIRDQLAEAAKPKPKTCKVCDWLSGQDEDTRQAVAEYLTCLSKESVWKILSNNGLPVQMTTFRRHIEHG